MNVELGYLSELLKLTAPLKGLNLLVDPCGRGRAGVTPVAPVKSKRCDRRPTGAEPLQQQRCSRRSAKKLCD